MSGLTPDSGQDSVPSPVSSPPSVPESALSSVDELICDNLGLPRRHSDQRQTCHSKANTGCKDEVIMKKLIHLFDITKIIIIISSRIHHRPSKVEDLWQLKQIQSSQ